MRCVFGMIMLVIGFVLIAKLATADVRRWNKDEEKVRQAVSRIDMGDFAGPGDPGHQLFHWVLACVDGVKVYTTTLEKKGGVHSVILPGKCDGTYARPTASNLPQNVTEEEATQPKKDWKDW